LKQMAKRTKELANPPVVRSEDVPHFLQHPFATQGEGKLREDQYRLEYGGSSLEPPKLTPDDFDAIMPGFLTEIEGGLDQLLYEIGEEPVQHIVLAGGSSYIRQFVDFVRKRFSHLYKDDKDITQFISFAEPENAIALGALEYQRNESEGKRSIRPRLSMSTYLEVDYDHEQGISEWQHRLSSVRFFRHNGKSYIELAQKGEPFKSTRPRLWPPQRLKYIPVRRSGREICWRIYQVRRVSRDEPDYKAIEPKTEPIDEIRMRLSWLQDLLPWLPISLVYAFDIYGDFYRMARPYLGLGLELKTQWEKASEFDWRDQDLIERVRQQYFQGE
jgi:hypothetical protein